MGGIQLIEGTLASYHSTHPPCRTCDMSRVTVAARMQGVAGMRQYKGGRGEVRWRDKEQVWNLMLFSKI